MSKYVAVQYLRRSARTMVVPDDRRRPLLFLLLTSGQESSLFFTGSREMVECFELRTSSTGVATCMDKMLAGMMKIFSFSTRTG